MYNFAEIFLKSLFIMRQFTILHLNFVCSHCNPKLYLVKTWDFSIIVMRSITIMQKQRCFCCSAIEIDRVCVERRRVPTLQICKRMWPQEKSHHQMGLLRFSYTYVLDILFSSNCNIHKLSYDLCFWGSDPLIERF